MTQYVEETYDQIAKAYTNLYFDDTKELPYFDSLIKNLNTSSKILDIGCGPGQFSKYFSEKGFYIEGIDISNEMLEIAKAKVPNVSFKKMDMRELTYKDSTFDAIFAAYSLIHIPSNEIDRVLIEIRRVLKPNGYALFIMQQGESDHVVDEPLAKGERIFLNLFTKERILKYITKNGFELINQDIIERDEPDIEDFSNTIISTLAARK